MNIKLHFVIATAALLMNFAVVQAQAPSLGAADDFALFTTVGVINNTGPTNITGDVGTDAGAYNGTPLPVVLGQVHITDPVTAQAAIDVNLAYAEMVAKPCGAVLGTGMGGGQLLTPGTYCIGGATTLNGDLTFDAVGDPNALFFIQIDGALSTGLGSQVLLLNSAVQCNIYWQINGAVDFGDNSSFQGIVLAKGQLTMLPGATLSGKAFAIPGAINMNTNTISSCTPAILPVALVEFTAAKMDAGTAAKLTWKTATESNSDHFLIERSVDGLQYSSIGQVLAAGDSDQMVGYSYIDESPAIGKNYYRLQQVDQNGNTAVSKVEMLTFAPTGNPLKIYPNPFGSTVVLHLRQMRNNAGYEWQLIDAMGNQLQQVTLQNEITHVDMTTVSPGMYFYRLTSNGTMLQSGRLTAAQ